MFPPKRMQLQTDIYNHRVDLLPKTKLLPACKVMDSQTWKYWGSFVDVKIGSFCVLKVSLHIGIKMLPACKVMDGQIWKYK